MSLIADDSTETFEKEVLVQFAQKDGTVKQGSFKAEYLRLKQSEIDDLDDNTPNSTLLDQVLKGVSGISRKGGVSMTPEEQHAFVLDSPECVNAAALVFFKATRPERYDEKTSKTRRSRG